MAQYIRISDYCTMAKTNKSRIYRAINSGIIKIKKIDGIKYIDLATLPEEFGIDNGNQPLEKVVSAELVLEKPVLKENISSDLVKTPVDNSVLVTDSVNFVRNLFENYEKRTQDLIKSHEETIETLKIELENKNLQIDNLINIMQTPLTENQTLKEPVFGLELDSEPFNSTYDSLSEDMTESIEHIDSIVEEHTYSLVEEENNVLKDRIEQLELTLYEYQTKIEELSAVQLNDTAKMPFASEDLSLDHSKRSDKLNQYVLDLETELGETRNRLQSLAEENFSLKQDIFSFEENYQNSQDKVAELTDKIENNKQSKELIDRIAELERQIESKDAQINSLQILLNQKPEMDIFDDEPGQDSPRIADLEAQIALFVEKQDEIDTEVIKYADKIRDLEEQLFAKTTRIDELENELSLKPAVNSDDKELESYKAQVDELTQELDDKKKKIMTLAFQLQQKSSDSTGDSGISKDEYDLLTAQIETRDQKIAYLEQLLADQGVTGIDKSDIIINSDASNSQDIEELRQLLAEKEEELLKERELVADLEQTKRELVASFVEKCNPEKAKEFLHMSNEGYENLIKSLEDRVMYLENDNNELRKLLNIEKKPDWMKKL